MFLKRRIDKSGTVHRFIEEVAYVNEKGEKRTIYAHQNGKPTITPIDQETLMLLDYVDNVTFQKYFVEGKT